MAAEKKVFQMREDRNPEDSTEGWVWFGLANGVEDILRIMNQINRLMEERQGLTPGENDYIVYPEVEENGTKLIVLGPPPHGRGPEMYFREVRA